MEQKAFKLGFRNKSVAERLSICRRFVQSVAKVPPEKRRYVKLAERQVQLANADKAVVRVEVLRSQLREAISTRNSLANRLYREVTCDASGILVTAENNSDVLAAGLELPKPKRPKGKPGVPTRLRGQAARISGAVELRWKRPLRRCFFVVQFTSDPSVETGWKFMLSCSNARCQVEGLRPGAQYWFRIAAGNAHGQGPWTSPMAVRAG
jgi:hypothetical protein